MSLPFFDEVASSLKLQAYFLGDGMFMCISVDRWSTGSRWRWSPVNWRVSIDVEGVWIFRDRRWWKSFWRTPRWWWCWWWHWRVCAIRDLLVIMLLPVNCPIRSRLWFIDDDRHRWVSWSRTILSVNRLLLLLLLCRCAIGPCICIGRMRSKIRRQWWSAERFLLADQRLLMYECHNLLKVIEIRILFRWRARLRSFKILWRWR